MKIKNMIFLAGAVLFTCGCYEDYVKDFDYDAVSIAYQYNLRSFVVGEGMEFQIGAMLSGVISNDRDRKVEIVMDDALVTEDLSSYTGALLPFNAFQIMTKYNTTSGSVSQGYVSDAVQASVAANGITALTPLPAELYSVEPLNLVIGKGRHTATAVVRADSAAFLADAHVGYLPYYAIGYRIVSADADSVIKAKSFSVVALRVESRFFGNWYHGGVSKVIGPTGDEISKDEYYTAIPSADATSAVYSLTTTGPYSVSANWFHNVEGSMSITLGEGNEVIVSDTDGRITDLGSSWNEDILLQNRKIYLNYKYADAEGNDVIVTDTLTFRNRIRDGINEYQDTNSEHYK